MQKRNAITNHCDAFIEVLNEFIDTEESQHNIIWQFAIFFASKENITDMFYLLMQHFYQVSKFISKESILSWSSDVTAEISVRQAEAVAEKENEENKKEDDEDDYGDDDICKDSDD